MTVARGGSDDRWGGRTGSRTGRHVEWLRASRTGILAVSLSLLTVLSLFAIPASGASFAGSGPAASLDDGANGPDPLAKGGPQGGNAGGNGSDAGGGGSGGDSTSDQDTGSSSAGSSGDDGSNEDSSGGADTDGGSSGDGSGDASNGGGDANENGGSNGTGASNAGGSSDSSDGNGKAKGGGSGSESGPPGSAGKGKARAPEVDVSVPGGPGAEGQSNAGGNGKGGNGAEGNGPPGAPPGEAGGGGPSVSVSAAGGGERGGGAVPPGAFGGQPPTSVVSVAVTNARSGDRVDLDVSPASVENDAVAFDGISLTVERDGDFTMKVTNSRGRLPGSPAFEPDQAAESLGRIRLDHSITNEEVEEVTYRFRVSKARLEATDTDPEEVALFRHEDGGWNELPTDVVGETESHYLLSSDSPGMSEFAVGAKRPDFDTFWADVAAGSVGSGEAVTVRGRVTNDGGADGVYDARLVVDGEVVAERSITIAAGGTRQVNFRAELERPGARRVSINGVPAGEITVEPRQVDSEDDEAEPAVAVLIDRLLDVSNALGITSAPADDG